MALVSSLLDLVFPRACAGCGGPINGELRHICWDCLAGFNFITAPLCGICGDPPFGLIEQSYVCAYCARRRPSFELARSSARYQGKLRRALHAFKYNGMSCLRCDFASLLAICVRVHYADIAFDAVTYAPLHARKERERTYNQSRLLARELALNLGISVIPNALARTRDTRTQTDLTARERKENVGDAFVAPEKQWIEGRTLLLVDDIMTTGATVNECSRVLKEAGAAGVYVVTVARG